MLFRAKDVEFDDLKKCVSEQLQILVKKDVKIGEMRTQLVIESTKLQN